MHVRLEGLNWSKVKGETCYCAWRGGPRLAGEPGTPEFIASYDAAVASRAAPIKEGILTTVLTKYQQSDDFTRLSGSLHRDPVLAVSAIAKLEKAETGTKISKPISKTVLSVLIAVGGKQCNCMGLQKPSGTPASSRWP